MTLLRTLLPLSMVSIVSFTSASKIDTIANNALVMAVDTTFAMNASSWNCFSYQTLNLIDSGRTKYFTTEEGVKFMGQDYRLGARIQTKADLNFCNKVVYFKWKGVGSGQYAGFVPQIKYDPFSNDGSPAIQGVDLGIFTVNTTFAGSVLIQENTWYYTRIVPISGSDNYRIITATGNYNNAGGTTISTTTIPILRKNGYIAFRIGDPYGSTRAFGVLGECKIAAK